MKKQRTILTAISVAAAAALALVSCQKTEQQGLPQEEDRCRLLIEASTESGAGTRASAAILESTTLTERFTIHMTSWMSPEDGTSGSAYFCDAPFRLDTSSGLWHSDRYRYWPVGVMLDFLCIAVDDSILDLTDLDAFKWNSGRSTSSVTVEVPNTQRRQSEILYASAYPTNKRDNVPVTFKHSQALLNFEFGSVDNQLVRLDSLTIEGIYMQGRLKVSNPGPDEAPHASWDCSYSYPVTAYVPGVKGSVLNGSSTSAHRLLVPAQSVGTLRLSYTIRQDTSSDWAYGVNFSRTLDLATSEWEQGKRYTYRINFKHSDFTITPEAYDITVEELTDEWTADLVLGQ